MSPNDFSAKQAAQALWEFDEVMAWIEWYFCGKDDELADRINQEVRDDLLSIRIKLLKEAEIQKGMQAAQISGSTSSYARKYALSGLLLVDDTDEVDRKEGDQTDWQGEIDHAKSVKVLMQIFNKMSPDQKKSFTESLSVKRKELENANA